MATKFEISTVFKAVDKVSAPVKRMSSNIARFSNSTRRNLDRVNKSLKKTSDIASKGVKATATAAAASGAAIAKVTDVGAEFEQQITNAAAKFPGAIKQGTDAFTALEDAARDVGATTQFSASQAAQGLDFLAMAGFDANNAIAALPQVVDLATVANTDLGMATDIATDTLGALGLQTNDTAQLMKNLARVNDVLAKTTTSTNTTLEAMFEAIKDGGPAATAAGADIETVSTLIGTMANAGIKGTRAGTALKNIFLAISAPGSEAATVMRRLGVETQNADGSVRDVVEVFKDFSAATKDLPSAQQVAVFDRIFGKIPIAAAINITNAADSLDTLRDNLRGAEGAASDMAAQLRDTTQADIKGMMSSIEGLTITLFDLNRAGIRETIQSATEWVRNFDAVLQSNDALGQSISRDVLSAVTNLVKVIGILIGLMAALKVAVFATNAAIVAFKVATFAATTATTAWGAATTAMPAILKAAKVAMLAFNIALNANPIGVVVTAVGALIAAGALLITQWDKVTNFFTNAWAKIKSGVSGVVSLLNPFKDLFGDVESITEKLQAAEPFDVQGVTPGEAVANPQDAVADALIRQTSSAEVILRNETEAKAEAGKTTGPTKLQIIGSGDFGL